MPRKPKPKYVAPAPPIAKLENVPGPEADAGTLQAHYRIIQEVFATHRYDDVIEVCHWCLDGEAELAFSKTDQPRGTRCFCSARCANGYTAYQVKVMQGGVTRATVATPSDSDETVDDSYDPVPVKTVKARRVKDVTETVGEEGTGKTQWKPAGERKARKPRAKKAARADGKCAKGLHEMTPDNLYSYNGQDWCRACRKASRDASAAKRKEG